MSCTDIAWVILIILVIELIRENSAKNAKQKLHQGKKKRV